MAMVDSDHNGSISYDEFISKMDIHISKKSVQAAELAKDVIFHKLKALIDSN